MPEWHDKTHDLNVVFKGNIKVVLEKKKFKDYKNIVLESCNDLAQRLGKLNQINQNICSYNYIHKELGLIIENINNERHRG